MPPLIMEGHIRLICGPMFSGKSSELLRKLRRYEHAKKSCLLISYEHDRRYTNDDAVATHDNMLKKAVRTDLLFKRKVEAMSYQVVGIDEGQFFPDIVEFCQLLSNHNIIVVVAALDSTFQRKPFGNIHFLLAKSQFVEKLTAVCAYCAKEAAFTKRTTESKEVELIGGAEAYKPVCRKCFYKESNYEERKSFSMENIVFPMEAEPLQN